MSPTALAARSRTARWLTLGVATVGSLLMVELGVRLFAPQPLHPASDEPLLRGSFVLPGDYKNTNREYEVTVHVNRDGFVDKEWEPPRADVPRVLLLGDSFIQAAQVALRVGFGRQLESELEEQLHREVDVLSMGVPGAGTGSELLILDRFGFDKQPDVVILGFFVSNDILNNHPLLEEKDGKPFFALRRGELVPVDATEALVPSWAVGPAWSFSQTWRLYHRSMARRGVVQRKIELGKGIPLDLRVHDPSPDPVWEEAWALSEALLAEVSRRCAEKGIGFGIVLIPDALQVSERTRASMTAMFPPVKGWDFSKAGDRALEIASQHAPAFDLRPPLSGLDEQLYFPMDGHWTPRGHLVAARAVAPFVEGLLAQRRSDLQISEGEVDR